MKKYIAECIGTFVLVFFACGTASVVGCNAEANAAYLLTALAFGLVIVAMAYSIGNVSGCHINPAVSIAMLVSGKMSVKDFVGYVAAQFVGAIAGAGCLLAVLSPEKVYGQAAAEGVEAVKGMGLGCNDLFNGSIGASLIIEVILTFVFVLAILGVTSKPEYSKVAGLVIGLSLTLVHILGIYFTGTSVNPARSFGPALLMGGKSLANVWVFLLAPMVGGVLAALCWKFLAAEAEK